MSDNSFSVEKPGKMLLEFAKARGERQYDWNNRQYFAMDVTEMGDMIANLSRGEGVQFYHDSSLGGNDSDGNFGGGGGGKDLEKICLLMAMFGSFPLQIEAKKNGLYRFRWASSLL